VQRLDKPVPKTYIGSGKAQQIADEVKASEIDVVIFDDELSPSQQANLERIMGQDVKVIDRTALILDIFGRHATTHEGRLQVQLAQNQYLLPRLRGMWSHLVREQTRGGIGSRFGQGESQLEVDRRLVRNRISALKRELTQLEKRRALQSKARWGSGVYRVALVGYTNAGKSTLLNALTDSNVYAKDELFATLDPTTRMVALEEGRQITLTDTVGFIQKLPTMLVEAFKSTLAEVLSADLILLVVDVSDKNAKKEIDAVREVLKDIGATDTKTVLVYNKCDLIPGAEQRSLALLEPHAEFISALQESGLQGLCYRIAKEAASGDRTLSVCIPYSEGKAMSMLHEQCQVIREQYVQEGLCATVKANARVASRLAAFDVPGHVATSHE
jgi:GTP-binding protein HflX